MARTVSRAPAPRPAQPMTLATSMRPAPADEEKGEAAVVAEPRLDRSALGYVEPRPGIDGRQYYAQCAGCIHFVPENAMRGAVSGDRCVILGADFTVTDDSTCAYFLPWPTGVADSDDVAENAEDMVEGEKGSITPWQAGFLRDTAVQCCRCRSFEPEENECSLYEALNTALPNVWALDEKVKPGACCSAWNPQPQPESMI